MSENTSNGNGMSQRNAPVFSARAGDCEVAVWEQEGKNGSFLTVTSQRNYKDVATGDWKKTNTLRVNDIPKMQLLLGKAYEYAKLGAGSKPEEEGQ